MMGTGFLDGFKEKKGNFEPPVKGAEKKAQPKKAQQPNKQQKVQDRPLPPAKKQVKTEKPKAVAHEAPAFNASANMNPLIARMIQSARTMAVRQDTYVMCGIAGHPKTGKTGMVLDSLTPDEVANGAEIWHLDFDLGGETTKAAHHKDKAANIVILNPWVFNYGDSRVPYDFPATFQKTVDILKAGQAQMEEQNNYYAKHGKMPNPYLKSVVFDGADHWLHITETCMKVDDLELGVDGIAVAGKKATTQIGRFNWNIRATRYQTAMVALRELCRGGVHAYIITHMKPAYDKTGNELVGQDSPKWLKDTEGHLQQVVYTEVEEERDENGELTGIVRGYARVVANRTSLQSGGRHLLFERNNDGGTWFGWDGMKGGDFDIARGDE